MCTFVVHVRRGVFVAWLLAVFASSLGCHQYERLPLDPTEEWTTLLDRAQSPGTRHSVESTWFPVSSTVDPKNGLDLAETNSLALSFNPQILAGRYSSGLSEAQLVQTRLLPNPRLFVGPRFSTDSSDIVVPASLSMALSLWGQRGAEIDASDAELRRAQLELAATELEVLVEVRRLFYRLRGLDDEISALDALASMTEQIATWVDGLTRSGEIDATTAWLTSWENIQLESLRLDKQAEKRQISRELLQLVGLLPGSAEFDVSGTLEQPNLEEPSLDSLENHPRARAARAAYEAAEAQLRVEVAKQYPEIAFGGEYEDDDGETSIGFGLSLELPLFDRNQGNIRAAEIAREAAREHYRAVLLELRHLDAKARETAALSHAKLRLLNDGPMSQSREALNALEARVRLGVSGVLEVLTAHRALAEAYIARIHLTNDHETATFVAAVAGGSALAPPQATARERTP